MANIGFLGGNLGSRGVGVGPGLPGFGILVNLESQLAYANLNLVAGYARIANDPPDPAYQQLVTLGPVTPVAATESDPVVRLVVGVVNATQQEGNLEAALLAALESTRGRRRTRMVIGPWPTPGRSRNSAVFWGTKWAELRPLFRPSETPRP